MIGILGGTFDPPHNGHVALAEAALVELDLDELVVLLVANPPDALDATKALAITEEPAGGSQAPTTKPIWVGTIS